MGVRTMPNYEVAFWALVIGIFLVFVIDFLKYLRSQTIGKEKSQ